MTHPNPGTDPDHQARVEHGTHIASDKPWINMAAVAAIVVAGMGLILGVGLDLHPIGVILSSICLFAGIALTVMALGDQRTGPALPIGAIVVGGVGLLIALMATADTDNDARISDDVTDADDTPFVEDADEIPENPAEIVNPEPAD